MIPADLPADFGNLAMIILLTGMRHGLDADHLSAIDGLTRYNARSRPRLARSAGVLFAVGHGLVLAGIAVGTSTLARIWNVPQWLEPFGAWVSIVFLTLLALLNIAAVLRTPGQEVPHLHGWRSGAFAGLLRAGSPLLVMGVGALFAVSFETMSQAALFTAAATQFGGWQLALAQAACFIDGVNGAWVARLIRRSDRGARTASRVMALSVSGVGLLTAALTLATQTLPHVEAWTQGKELWFGATVVGIVALSFVLGRQLTH
jgi:high-affinity nickel-transport protein